MDEHESERDARLRSVGQYVECPRCLRRELPELMAPAPRLIGNDRPVCRVCQEGRGE